MNGKGLPSELTALVHQIELSDPSWRKEMVKKIVIATCFKLDSFTSREEIRKKAKVEYGTSIDKKEVDKAVEELISEERIVESTKGVFRISNKEKKSLNKKVDRSEELEAKSKEYLESLANKSDIIREEENIWDIFKKECLIPLIKELGARTFRLVEENKNDLSHIESYRSFVNRFENEEGAKSCVKEFLGSEEEYVKSYVLRNLHAYLLSYANDLGEEEIKSIRGRIGEEFEMNVFIDTNVLLSIFDIRSNPANQAVKDLIKAIYGIEGVINLNLYILADTVKEFKKITKNLRRKISSLNIPKNISKSAQTVEIEMGGVIEKFVDYSAKEEGRTTAGDFLDVYISNPAELARERNIEIFNQSLDFLEERDSVLEDASDIYRQAGSKSFEAAEHDAKVWHFTREKRGGYSPTPLRAGYWAVTIDYSLIRWEQRKLGEEEDSLPVFLSPSDLSQMLQVWVPRSEEMKDAMFHSIVSLLPEDFGGTAEQTTIDILDALSSYEGIEDVGEKTITEMIANNALRSKIEDAKNKKEKVELIENELTDKIEEKEKKYEEEKEKAERLKSRTEETKDLLKAKEKYANSLSGKLYKERKRSEYKDDILNKKKEEIKSKERELDEKEDKISKLENRVEDVEEDAENYKESVEQKEKIMFSFAFILSGLVGYMLFFEWAFSYIKAATVLGEWAPYTVAFYSTVTVISCALYGSSKYNDYFPGEQTKNILFWVATGCLSIISLVLATMLGKVALSVVK